MTLNLYLEDSSYINTWIGAYEKIGFMKVKYKLNFRFFRVLNQIVKSLGNFLMCTKDKILKENNSYESV